MYEADVFLVVGKKTPFITDVKLSVSRRINENPEFVTFLNELAQDGRFEVAYRGYPHGKLLGEKYLT